MTEETKASGDSIEVVNGFFNVICGTNSYGFRVGDLKAWQYELDTKNFIIQTSTQRIVFSDYKNIYAKQFARMVGLCYPVVTIELVKP